MLDRLSDITSYLAAGLVSACTLGELFQRVKLFAETKLPDTTMKSLDWTFEVREVNHISRTWTKNSIEAMLTNHYALRFDCLCAMG